MHLHRTSCNASHLNCTSSIDSLTRYMCTAKIRSIALTGKKCAGIQLIMISTISTISFVKRAKYKLKRIFIHTYTTNITILISTAQHSSEHTLPVPISHPLPNAYRCSARTLDSHSPTSSEPQPVGDSPKFDPHVVPESFPYVLHETLFLSMMVGNKTQLSNDVNPDTVQVEKITPPLTQTGTRTAPAQLVLPPCDAQALAALLSGSKAPHLHRRLSCSATHDRAHLASKHHLPHSFTWRGDIADVRARADIK